MNPLPARRPKSRNALSSTSTALFFLRFQCSSTYTHIHVVRISPSHHQIAPRKLESAMEEVLWEMLGEDTNQRGLPPGFRFYPTDEELVTFYLAAKVFNGGFAGVDMVEIDLNRCEPWELPDAAKLGEKEWYFYSLRDRKYPTGLRTNRATESGYWKATGKDREVCSSGGAVVGMKKTLVFYNGRAPRGEKTKWVLHEYRLDGDFSQRLACKEEWVICRIFKKTGGEKKTSAFQNLDYLFDASPSPSSLLAYPSLAEMQALNPPMGYLGKDSSPLVPHPDDKLHRSLPMTDPILSFPKSDSHQRLPKEINSVPEQCSSILSNLVDADPQMNRFVVGAFPPFFRLQEESTWLGAAGCLPESGALGSCVLPMKTYDKGSNFWPNHGESLWQADPPMRSPETSSHPLTMYSIASQYELQ